MMDFPERDKMGTNFEKKVANMLHGCGGISIIPTGVEKLFSQETIIAMRSSGSKIVHSIRYAPDFLLIINRDNVKSDYFVECKATHYIERYSYEVCLEHSMAGRRVLLFSDYGGDVVWNYIENVGLIDGNEDPNYRGYKVIDGWIYPRLSPNMRPVNGSGTPFKRIKPYSLRSISFFRSEILKITPNTENRLIVQPPLI